jgi:hypothetical protein
MPAIVEVIPWIVVGGWMCCTIGFWAKWSRPGISLLACKWELRCVAAEWCTCQDVQVLWNLLSFLAFHMHHKMKRDLHNRSLAGLVVSIIGRVTCTPSCSGKMCTRKRGLEEAQTNLGSSHWKNKWKSFSMAPQYAQCWSMWTEYLPALSPVARAYLISLQANVDILLEP